MKLQLFSSDRQLHRNLSELPGIESVEVVPHVNENTARADVLVISDSLLNIEEVRDLKQKAPSARLIYLVQNQTGGERKQIQMICASHGIHFVPPYHDLEKTVQDIGRHLFPHTFELQAGNRIAFFSSHPGAGLTSVTMGVADLIAKQTSAKIAVLHLNPWNPGVYETKGKSLDELHTDLKHRTLTHDALLQSFGRVNQVHVLQGNRDLTMTYKYDPKSIAYLIETASEMFDLVLLDVGAYVDAPTSIQAMLSADIHYLVTTQERKGIETFIRTHDQILNWLPFDVSSFLLVVNKVSDKFTVAPKSIAGKYGMHLLQEVPLADDATAEEIDNQTLLLSESRQAEGALAAIAGGLINQYELPLHQEQPKGLRHWLFGGKSAREA